MAGEAGVATRGGGVSTEIRGRFRFWMISVGAQINIEVPKHVSSFQNTGGMCPGKKTPGGRLRQSPIDSFPRECIAPHRRVNVFWCVVIECCLRVGVNSDA